MSPRSADLEGKKSIYFFSNLETALGKFYFKPNTYLFKIRYCKTDFRRVKQRRQLEEYVDEDDFAMQELDNDDDEQEDMEDETEEKQPRRRRGRPRKVSR